MQGRHLVIPSLVLTLVWAECGSIPNSWTYNIGEYLLIHLPLLIGAFYGLLRGCLGTLRVWEPQIAGSTSRSPYWHRYFIQNNIINSIKLCSYLSKWFSRNKFTIINAHNWMICWTIQKGCRCTSGSYNKKTIIFLVFVKTNL
jgi:hypothetical protein